MTHRAPRLIVAALGLVAVGTLAACNDDTESSATSTTVAADTTVAAETTTTLPEVATLPPAETVAPTAPDGPVQIDVVVVANQLVRQAARLGTLATISAAASQRFTRQALAGVGDTKSAVNERFQFNIGLPANLANLSNREFSGQYHPFDP